MTGDEAPGEQVAVPAGGDVEAVKASPGEAGGGADVAGSRPGRRTVAASMVGTVLEWYDFNLYGFAAAVVLGEQFFPRTSPTARVLASFATFAAGFAARPVGGLLFGHFGDRLGRARMLVVTMVVTGCSSALLGLLPTYRQAGWPAPVGLVVLRVVQGVGVGGEFAGAALMTMENAPPGRRGFFGAVPAMGTGAGFVLAAAAFALAARLPGQALMAWGWRLPFLGSLVLVAFGLLVRRRLPETAEFTARARARGRAETSLLTAVRGCPGAVVRTMGVSVSCFIWGYMIQGFVVHYGATELHIARSTLLWALAVASAVSIGTLPMWGAASDRWGRRTVITVGLVGTVAYAWPFFALLHTRSPLWILVALVVALPVLRDLVFAPQVALCAEMFDTGVRYTGLSAGREFAGALSGGTAPFVATALHAATHRVWPVVCYVVAGCAVTAVAVLLPTSRPGGDAHGPVRAVPGQGRG
ncbi:MFS transporter [Streptantibioticus cattleyicolor]|uniref:Major facilitator superfamily transporter metabolite/H(+) symporter n=1 Tax=Streptantibioticus cattleyicolor (strain ATCC 35852 / DSM 46488 / JCM 4925 / NBRC 14057 / NRRL 8057) TaxID=1003195 RepID=G8XE29_STREN|nr:MFS transporter [Streptantibioticus cattleyicolor]AEW98292.1 major facilitator superfamily transporter metabolite/H(+) symporter [Streptantibioticus cattleyicolor NRRL 8057 = DSM 46488]